MRRSEFLLLLMAAAADGSVLVVPSGTADGASETVAPTILVGTSFPLTLSPWAWWDMQDLTNMYTTSAGSTHVAADTDLCGRIEDKSGNARNMTCLDAERPMYKTSVAGGLGALLFGSGGTYKILTSAATVPTTDFSIAAVFKTPATITGGVAYGPMNAYHSTNGGTRPFYIDTDSVLKSSTSPTLATITDLTPTTSTPYVGTLRIKNASTRRTLQINGRTIVTNDTAVTSPVEVFRVGGHSNNNVNNFWTGHVCEVIIFSPGLAEIDMANVRLYLNNKWTVY